MLFENSRTDQRIKDELDKINSSLKAEEEKFSYSIEEFDKKTEQTRERISEVESVYTRVKWTFIVCIILALIICVCSFNSNVQLYHHAMGGWRLISGVLGDVLVISSLLFFPWVSLCGTKAGVEVDGGTKAIFLYGVALVAEGCGIYYGEAGFCECATVLLVGAAAVIFVSGEGGLEEIGWGFVLAFIVCTALGCYFIIDNHQVTPVELWLYVITAFGATIFVAWRFKITYDEEGDRLRELIREYEKKIKEKKAFEDRKKGYAYESILAKKARLEEELRTREEQIAEMYEEESDPEWETPAFQPEEELSDEEKLKRAIDRFRV